MQAIEFETDISSNVINIPINYRENLKNKHVKILAVYSDRKSCNNEKMKNWDELKETLTSFDLGGEDPVDWQREVRSEWENRL